MSAEVELKFRVPPARLPALRRAVATRAAQVLPLAAVYFDTPGELLAQARLALRLRREGDRWVQTLKAEGASAMQRLEHNAELPVGGAARRRPTLELSRHDGSAAGQVLREVLTAARDEPLLERYATEVQRTRRVLQAGDARIELALDEGQIRAGRHRLPICEVEFELLQGTPQALLAVAAQWAERFGLVLDVRSKSERGHALAAGRLASPPAKARPLRLGAGDRPAEARAAMLAHALGQALANASQIADGPSEPEHLHQLRVGLRRMRSLLRVYGGLSSPLEPTLAPELAALFDQLGAARDLDAMAEWLWPLLRAADAPWLPGPDEVARLAEVAGGAAPVDVTALLRSPATQRLWLSALAACQSAPDEPAVAAPPLRELLSGPLQQLMRQVRKDAGRFATLEDERRHRLRRRIKRLRYAAEAAAPLWPAKPVARTLRALAAAQEPLGAYNDTVVAIEHFRRLAERDGRAWFVVGWLSARRDALTAPCAGALARLARQRGFWQAR
ncbi:MAG: CYTH and CHAD domain-containing protein [Burkholderiaceae bacterium]|nr:CYTH and CHAD domain-containing protein [Burkholderiaceae bacterium]